MAALSIALAVDQARDAAGGYRPYNCWRWAWGNAVCDRRYIRTEESYCRRGFTGEYTEARRFGLELPEDVRTLCDPYFLGSSYFATRDDYLKRNELERVNSSKREWQQFQQTRLSGP